MNYQSEVNRKAKIISGAHNILNRLLFDIHISNDRIHSDAACAAINHIKEPTMLKRLSKNRFDNQQNIVQCDMN